MTNETQRIERNNKGPRLRSTISFFTRSKFLFKTKPTTDIINILLVDKTLDQGNQNKAKKIKKIIFWLMVILPSLFAAFYYGFLASDQYQTESRLIVRTIGISDRFDQSENREGRAIIGGDSLNQDAYIVANYLQSPQLVSLLKERLDLHSLFSTSTIDILSRLPKEATLEELHKFWQRQTYISVDGPSGIITFGVRAFKADDSVAISDAALDAASDMIDALSERAKTDVVKRAESEVVQSLENYQRALDTLRNYQNEVGILDPLSNAKAIGSVVAALIERKLRIEATLNTQLESGLDKSVITEQLQRLASALDKQIKDQRELLTSRSDKKKQLSENLLEFSRYETQRFITKRIYQATIRNLDTAKSTALRRTTFLAIFSPAQKPQESVYPKRLSAWFIVFIGLLTFWIIGTLIWASIEDHRN